MIYIFCPRSSSGARQLAKALRKMGAEASYISDLHDATRGNNSMLINWGSPIPLAFLTWWGNSRVLNPVVSHNKYNELLKLSNGGVMVPPFSLEKKDSSWMARTINHSEARDLLSGMSKGDYYVKYVPTSIEFRVHILNGRSIRTGIKLPRIESPNKRFRSWIAGWGIDYGTPCQAVITNQVREAARAACKTLKYDFGAVDVGMRDGGEPVVFEVNSAPGFEGNTVTVYAQKFKEIFDAYSNP